jgi:hypothetical protein
MKPKLLLTLSAVWIILIGVAGAFLSYTGTYDIEVAEPALLDARFRVPISLYFGLAVINWFARNSDASKARDAIFLGNTLGFIVWAAFVALVTLTPGSDPTGWGAVVINLFFAIAFFVVVRANMSTSAS